MRGMGEDQFSDLIPWLLDGALFVPLCSCCLREISFVFFLTTIKSSEMFSSLG
jgi:hypothetical protein